MNFVVRVSFQVYVPSVRPANLTALPLDVVCEDNLFIAKLNRLEHFRIIFRRIEVIAGVENS